MKEVSLSGSKRQGVGKKDAKAVRNAGLVPCIIYGKGEQTSISIKHTDLQKVIVSPNVYIINIDVEGKAVKAIVQDVQFHPVTDNILHVDFLELQEDRKVKIDIPVRTVGRAIGVMNGGRLQQVFRKLKVYAYPGDLPDSIEVDISKLRIGGMIRVGQLATDKLEMLNPANAVVVGIKMARGAVDSGDDEEEGEAAPAEGGGEAAPAEEAAAE